MQEVGVSRRESVSRTEKLVDREVDSVSRKEEFASRKDVSRTWRGGGRAATWVSSCGPHGWLQGYLGHKNSPPRRTLQ